MKRLIIGCILAFASGIFLNTPICGELKQTERPWIGQLVDGTPVTEADLKEILVSHKIFLETDGKEGKRANLEGAMLAKADLKGVDLSGALLMKVTLDEADLEASVLNYAFLESATLFGANLKETGLRETLLRYSNLEGSNLWEADVTGAYFWGANLKSVMYDPKKGLPELRAIARADNLHLLTFDVEPDSLVELREAFKQAGMRKQEREITYAINRTRRIHSWQRGPWDKIESVFNLIMFEITCQYGMSPGRVLWMLLVSVVFFSFPYFFFLKSKGKEGIWKVWLPERIRSDLGEKSPIRLSPRGLQAVGFALYFSVLSAFSIGYREFNVGNWINRIQSQEYTLKATGWARTVSGVQSLVSVYFLALWLLTYFGRPFE